MMNLQMFTQPKQNVLGKYSCAKVKTVPVGILGTAEDATLGLNCNWSRCRKCYGICKSSRKEFTIPENRNYL
jgi:hypothetical protein